MTNSLKRFYRNVLQHHTSFVSGTNEDRINALELESHLATATYGNFTLTEAIRPSLDLSILPVQGYKRDKLEMEGGRYPTSRTNSHSSMPFLVISVSLEQLFDTFLDLLDPLGNTVNVELETSHYCTGVRCTELQRDYIDLPVLKSFLYEHEDLLLNDGCAGISIFSPKLRAFVKFDEHKLILVRAKSLLPFEKILRRHHVPLNVSMPLLTDAEHVHITRDEYVQQFKTLQVTLGMDESYTTAR